MAKRPIFTPDFSGFPYVDAIDIEFKWHPGFAKSQLQKSIASLHEAAEKLHKISPILEISGKSASDLGSSLSAFNLSLELPNGRTTSVECAYQGSKVFENGGPYHELYDVSSREAKTDERLQNSGELVSFNFYDEKFHIEPKDAFYNLLYIAALCQKETDLMPKLEAFQGFSDIAFNPNRSLNCQARAAALFVSLSKNGWIDKDIFYLGLTRFFQEVLCISDPWDSFPVTGGDPGFKLHQRKHLRKLCYYKDYYFRLATGTKRPIPSELPAYQLDLPF